MPCLPSPPRNKDQTRTNNQTKGRGHKEDTELTTDDPKHYKTRRPYHHHLKVVNHLQMTQKVIGRMAACSFAVKAFSLIYLLLGAAIIVEPLTRSTAVIAVYLPIVMMWWLTQAPCDLRECTASSSTLSGSRRTQIIPSPLLNLRMTQLAL